MNNDKILICFLFILFVFARTNSAQTSEKLTLTNKVAASDNSAANQNNFEIKSEKIQFSSRKNDFAKKNGEKKYLSENYEVQNSAAANEADDDSDNYKLERGAKELNIEIGYSPFQPTFFAEKEYDTRNRSFGMINLRWGRVIGTAKGVTYEYQAEITPLSIAFHNEVKNPAYRDAQTTPNVPKTIRRTTYGWGFAPAGFRFIFLPKKRLKPFAAAHAGFMFFSQPVPLPDTLDYDFTGDVGGGVMYQIKKKQALTIGYKYFHISNMNIGKTNPGYNANVFYVGYSFFYK